MATDLFDDFNPFPPNNGNKKSNLNLRADYNETVVWNSQRTFK
jgi:hypothetical protein